MTDRQRLVEAMRAAGIEDAGKPRTKSYVNPKFVQPAEEPAAVEPVEEQQETPTPAQTTSTRPVPTGDPGPHLPPRGGSNPDFTIPLPHEEVRDAVERQWARQNGTFVPARSTSDQRAQGGRPLWMPLP